MHQLAIDARALDPLEAVVECCSDNAVICDSASEGRRKASTSLTAPSRGSEACAPLISV